MERCGCEVRGEERQVDGGYVAREGGEERRVDGSRGAGGGLLTPVRSGTRSGQQHQRMEGTWRAETGDRGARIPARPSPGGRGPGRPASAQAYIASDYYAHNNDFNQKKAKYREFA